MTSARGHLELLDDRLPDGPDREDVDVALDELRRLSRMSDSLLLLATADEPRFLSRVPLDVSDLLVDVAGRWEAATRRHVGVDAARSVTVRADEDRLRTALNALVENALQATEGGGSVGLAMRDDGRGIALEVRDTEPGVPAEAQERIFDRFCRIDVESARRASGLGLAVVKAVAAAHGGDVSLESEPGHTVFAIHLPMVSAAPAPRPGPVPAAAGSHLQISNL